MMEGLNEQPNGIHEMEVQEIEGSKVRNGDMK